MPKFTTVINATGPNGNIFAVLGNATVLMKELRISPFEIQSLREKVFGSKSYEEALDHIREYFPVKTE